MFVCRQWSCVRQRQLSRWHPTIYTKDVSAAQELWNQSAFLFLLTALQIDMVRSSPQKRIRLLNTVNFLFSYSHFTYCVSYTDYLLKCRFSARNDGSSELDSFLQSDESCATVYLETIMPCLVDKIKKIHALPTPV